jgi:hypothetical protein
MKLNDIIFAYIAFVTIMAIDLYINFDGRGDVIERLIQSQNLLQ